LGSAGTVTSEEAVMGCRDAFWRGVPRDGEGNILWPEDRMERAELVRQIWGWQVMASVDAILTNADRVVSAVDPEAVSPKLAADEICIARALSGLTVEQRSAVRDLVQQTCGNTVRWTLAEWALPSASMEVRLKPVGPKGRGYPEVIVDGREMRALLFDWVVGFSEHLGADARKQLEGQEGS
jgi:hypothetical protein